MALTLRPGCNNFFGEFLVGGKKKVVSLGIAIEGRRPATLRERGDDIFEASRAKARKRHDELREELTQPGKAADRLRRIHEIQLGATLEKTRVDQILEKWLHADRRQAQLSKAHVANARAAFTSFHDFLRQRYPNVTDAALVTKEMARGYMATVANEGVTPKTYNNRRAFLAAFFEVIRAEAGLPQNPFSAVPRKSSQMVHRRPFSSHEIQRLLDALEDDAEMRPVVVTALCTGMRLGNCALLRWRNVNRELSQINVLVRKTKKPIWAPILPRLKAVLQALPQTGEFCFPKCAATYQRNPQFFSHRWEQIVQRAGISYFEADPESEDGPRKRRASTHGFHALKTTFVTLALEAGIAEARLRKIVGNTAVDVVMNHYYQPDYAQIAKDLEQRMPAILTGTDKKTNETAAERLEALSRKIAELPAETAASELPAILADLDAIRKMLPR